MQVTGIYTPPTPSDYWFGSLNPFPPPDSTQLPPSIVDPAGYLALTAGYAMLYIAILLTIAVYVFSRRDFK